MRPRVAAALIAGLALALTTVDCTGGASAPAATHSPSPPAAPHIVELDAKALNAVTVELTWVAAGPTASSYVLLRNGASLATLPGTTTTYTDQSAEPDHPYEYAVRLGGSESSSAEVTATIRTPKAPRLSKARIAGTIDVKR